MKRREFLQLTGLAAGVGILAVATKELFREPTVAEISAELLESHKVFIPPERMRQFSSHTINRANPKLSEITPNAEPTFEEMTILKDSIKKLPSLELLTSYVTLYRRLKSPYISGTFDDTFEPRNISGIPQFIKGPRAEITIPAHTFNYKEPYDNQKEEIYKNASLQSILFYGYIYNEMPVDLNSGIKDKNEAERLQSTVLHEAIGHGFWNAITNIWNPNQERWFLNSPLGWLTPNHANPLMLAFAKASGWELITVEEMLKRYGDTGYKFAQEFIDSGTFDIDKNQLVWDRKINIWGTPLERKVRVGAYGDYGPPTESFAEYFTAFYTHTDILTDSEYTFFSKIDKGLRHKNRHQFMAEIINNPAILL